MPGGMTEHRQNDMRTYRICTANLLCLAAADLDQRCPKINQEGTSNFKK
jgi:hypothetical protein